MDTISPLHRGMIKDMTIRNLVARYLIASIKSSSLKYIFAGVMVKRFSR